MSETSLQKPIDTIDEETSPDTLAAALGQVVAREREQYRRLRELVEAQVLGAIAHLRAESIEKMTRLESQIAERLASLQNGKDGAPGERGAEGPIGQQGPAGPAGSIGEQGLEGKQGEKGAQGDVGPQGPAGPAGPVGATGEQGADGKQGEKGEQGPQGPAGKDGADGAPGPAGQPGVRGDIGPQGPQGEPGGTGPQGQRGEQGVPGADGKDGAAGDRGPQGAPGPAGAIGPEGPRGFEGPAGQEGPAGKLPIVKVWADEIHYAGAVVAHEGATWQAERDTGKEPGKSRDWTLLAGAGRNGITPQVRGTWSAELDYRALDVVALNGGSFIARRDQPGPCPGDGWQLLASQGKQGRSGEAGAAGAAGAPGARGDRGLKGDRGEPGAHIIKWRLDRKNYRALAMMSDGGELALDLRELFEQFHLETKA